ncbi:hypothetical protein BKA62DRAFT_619999 [Auriculariales sp. MPI-PUGE-AT-0066]|nr:hypothetical protein BKA62DRAFT_619999 [Auriculariales sp. MPI-PUGE-AT-0066]
MVGPDEVEPKDVVERFLDLAFGDERDDREDELEGDWSRSKISRRVLALRTKQRGNPAPTPRMARRAPSETPSMLVPEFTPLISHGVVHAGGKGRVYPDLHNAGRRTPQSARGTVNFPRQVAASIEDVPAELVNLTPRLKSPPPKSPSRRQFVPSTPSHIRVAIEPPSSAKRMMGYLGSWLGVSKPLARSRDVPSTVPSRTGPRLPPPPPARERNVATPPRRLTEREKAPTASLHRPPPSVRELSPDAMHPRDSVDLQHATPRQWEPEDILHPRDSVDLQHAEQSIYEPERIIHPRDTVQLQHVSPPPQQAKPALGRQRTASGSSVKDLIKNFEASTTPARNSDLELARLKMQRSRSFQNLSQHTASQSNAAVVRSASVNMSASPSWRS